MKTFGTGRDGKFLEGTGRDEKIWDGTGRDGMVIFCDGTGRTKFRTGRDGT